MEDKKPFGEYILKRRKDVGLTQKEFAEKLFVTESAVSKWERGLSYPDITLISDICKILSVSEHELLTASDDMEARNSKKLARRYLRMVSHYKNILGFLYGFALLVCFICNIAVSHRLSWFFIVAVSEMVAASVTLLPVIIPDKKGPVTLGAFTLTLSLLLFTCCLATGGDWFFIAFISLLFGITLFFLPYLLKNIHLPNFFRNKKALLYYLTETILLFVLLYICCLFTGGNWFFTIALPITVYSLILPWGMLLILRYTKADKYLKAAGCLALTDLYIFSLQGFISLILKDGLYHFGIRFHLTNWNIVSFNENVMAILFIVLLVLTILFLSYGLYRTVKAKALRNNNISNISKKISIFIITSLLLITGQTQASASGRSDELEHINTYLEQSLKAAHIPGASLCIVDRDKVLYQNTYGNCNNINDSFIIGSLSKSFTAMAVMKLTEEHKISLDSPIARYLPDAADGERITVRQLLNQTSGITKYARQDNYKVSSRQGKFVYANANYGLLGQIIEKTSGCSYGSYIHDNIFVPAGMLHSYTSYEAAKKDNLLGGYRNYFGVPIKERISFPAAGSKGWLSVPAGYIISSAADMGKYLQVYLKDGDNIISGQSIRTMFYDNVEVQKDIYYGMGWGFYNNFSEPFLEHGGLVENYSTAILLQPKKGIGLILMMNMNDYLVSNDIMYAVTENIKKIMLGENPAPVSKNDYWRKHLLIDLICLAVVFLCLIPILRIKKWIRRWKGLNSSRCLIGVAAVHIILPTVILIVFHYALATPFYVVWRFAPDIFIILVLCCLLLYTTGFSKIIIKLKSRHSLLPK